jgi:aspartate aminotransferase
MAKHDARLATRTTQDTGSEIRIMFERAQSVEDVVRLEIGEPDFDTPLHVVDAAAEAAAAGATHYTSTYGLPELREAIAEKVTRDNDVPVGADGVLVTNGGIEALALGFLAVVDPGSKVVLPTPEWTNYAAQIRLAGGEPVRVPLNPETGFNLDADRIIEAMSDDTDAVVLCRPNNPTGRVYGEDSVRAVVEAAADHEAYVVADEVYERLTYEGTRRSAAALGEPEWVISVNSFSKGYAMTGWRLGWLAGPTPVVDAAQVIRQQFSLCSSSVAQQAGLEALTGPQEPFEEMVETYRERRSYALNRIADVPELDCVAPEGAFYLFCDAAAIDGTSMEIATDMLQDHSVSVTPGSGFGDAGAEHLRISYATSIAELERGFDRIERYLDATVR